jgi:hypothetical protein
MLSTLIQSFVILFIMIRIPNSSIAFEGEWGDEIDRMKYGLFRPKTWLLGSFDRDFKLWYRINLYFLFYFEISRSKNMSHFLIGASLVAGFFLLLNWMRRRQIRILWWKWIPTVLCFLYAVFVLEMINSFLAEGALRAALVMGIITGFIAVVWGVLLGRFVFARKERK